MDANQLARLQAGHTDFEYQVFAGPRRGFVAEQDVTEGSTYTATATTTLAAHWDGSATTLSLTDASGFANAGAVYTPGGWVLYSGWYSYYTAKWFGYSGKSGNTLTGVRLLREWGQTPSGGEVGAPPPTSLGQLAGSVLTAWVDVTAIVTTIELTEAADDVTASWQAVVGGHDYDSQILAQNASLLVMWRQWPHPGDASNWSDWTVLFMGYIGAGRVGDDYKQGAEWSLPVRPIDMYLENADAPSRRYGRSNLALGQSTTTSTPLSDASLIGHSGEVVGSPSLDGENVTDESLSTVYCSQTVPSRTAGSDVATGIYIGEVGWGPVGSGADGAYLVIWAERGTLTGDTTPMPLERFDLWTHITSTPATTLTQAMTAISPANGENLALANSWALTQHDGIIRIDNEEIGYSVRNGGGTGVISITRAINGTAAAIHNIGATVYQAAHVTFRDLDSVPEIPINGRVIVCRDRATFESWCSAGDIQAVEWRSLQSPWQDGERLNTLRQAGEKVRVRGPQGNYITQHTVSWGAFAESGWPGAALTYGQALRCTDLSAPTNPANWEITNAPEPGRNVQATAQAYVSVEVPAFAITLAADIGTGDTEIQITPTASGLTQAGGTIQIDVEQITYTGVTYISGNTYQLDGCVRGGGAGAAVHVTGATIYQVENATAHTMEQIGRVGWQRKRVLDDDGNPIVPKAFDVYYSTYTSPNYPDETDPTDVAWKLDWTRLDTADGWAQTTYEYPQGQTWAGARMKHVMVVILEMSDGGRALINNIEFMRTQATDANTRNEDTIGAIVQTVLVNDFGLDSSQVTTSPVGTIGTHLVSARTRYMDLLEEMAKLAGSVITITRDNRVVFGRSPYHPMGLTGISDIAAALDRSTLRRANVTHGQANRISQVRLTLRNPASGESFVVNHPPSPKTLGSPLEMERVFFGSTQEGAYLAELIYLQANSKTVVAVEPRGSADGLRLWDRVTLDWDLDRSGALYNANNFIVTGLSLSLRSPLGQPKVMDWGITLRSYIT